jgi:hypothetical protein
MFTSKELTQIIVFAILGLIYTVFAGQMGYVVTGIPGANFLFIVGYVTITSIQFLLYEGKRWRYFISTTLFVLLIFPTNFAGTAFSITTRIPIILVAFIFDLCANSFYGFFARRNKLFEWNLLTCLCYHISSPFISILTYYVFTPPEFVTMFINGTLLMLPVIIIETIIGALVGYKVYERVKKL